MSKFTPSHGSHLQPFQTVNTILSWIPLTIFPFASLFFYNRHESNCERWIKLVMGCQLHHGLDSCWLVMVDIYWKLLILLFLYLWSNKINLNFNNSKLPLKSRLLLLLFQSHMKTRLSLCLPLYICLFLSFSPQLNSLSKENKCLRRQLEEERSMRRRAEKHCSSIHLPLSLRTRPPAPLPSLPPSCRRPPSLRSDMATGDIQAHSVLSGAGPGRPGESQALGGTFRKKAGCLSGRFSVWENKQGPDQMKPPEDFDLSWLFDLLLLTRERTQYEVNVLQVKVKSQGAFCLKGAWEAANVRISWNHQNYCYGYTMRTFIPTRN